MSWFKRRNSPNLLSPSLSRKDGSSNELRPGSSSTFSQSNDPTSTLGLRYRPTPLPSQLEFPRSMESEGFVPPRPEELDGENEPAQEEQERRRQGPGGREVRGQQAGPQREQVGFHGTASSVVRRQPRTKARRSGLMTSACVESIPCGNPG